MLNRKLFAVIFVITSFLSLTKIPAAAVSREMCISAIISNSSIDYENADDSLLDSFSDGDDMEYKELKNQLCAALENGIITGYEDGTLKLREDVTRAEFACMIYRARDFYKAPPLQSAIKYNGTYGDVSGWNEKEILFCIENGYLMGYGDKFGADDAISSKQIETVIHRMNYGLSAREKYSLYEVCGISPLSMKAALNSVYTDEIRTHELPLIHKDEIVYEVNTNEIALNLESLLETIGNMDYEKFQNEAYTNLITDSFKGVGYAGAPTSIQIIDGSEHKSMEDKIRSATEDRIIRESIVVISPQNNQKSAFYTAFNRTVGVGYELYCYKAAGTSTPNGEKIGAWYKRKIVADFTQYITASSRYATLKCEYGVSEEI